MGFALLIIKQQNRSKINMRVLTIQGKIPIRVLLISFLKRYRYVAGTPFYFFILNKWFSQKGIISNFLTKRCDK